MNDALERIREYFAERQDASCEPGDDRYRGNEAMDRLADVEEVALLFSEDWYRVAATPDGDVVVTLKDGASAVFRASGDLAREVARRIK